MTTRILKAVLVAWMLLSPPLSAADFPVDEQAIYQEILALEERIGTVSAKDQEAAEKLVEKGIEAHDRQDYEAALKFYRKALEKDPLSGRAYYEMAHTQESSGGDMVAALGNTLRAIALAPQLQSAYVLLGILEDNLGFPERALTSYDRLLEFNADSYLALLNKGITLSRLGRVPEAEAAYKAAMAASPREPSPYLRLAQAARLQGFGYDEEKYLEQFLERAGKDPRAQAATQRLQELRHQEVLVDPNSSYRSIDFFLAAARAQWKGEKHRALHPEARGYRLTFEEERDVLQKLILGLWRQEKATNPAAAHPYYDPLLKIDDAGYFDVYVYHQRQAELGEEARVWLAENEDRVAAFLAWAQAEGLTGEAASEPEAPAAEDPGQEDRELPSVLIQVMSASAVPYSLDVAKAEDGDFFDGERRRWKKFRLPAGEATECGKDLLAEATATYAGSMAPFLAWARCFGPEDKEWEDLGTVSRLGFRYHDLAPHFPGRIEVGSDGAVSIAFPRDSTSWMAYLLAKALWRREPTLLGPEAAKSNGEPSLAEEVLGLRAAIAGYVNSLESEGEEAPPTPDPYFETLREVRDAGLLWEFALFEILHKRYGVSLRQLDGDVADRVDQYLSKYVFRR